MKVQEMTTEELEWFVRNDAATRVDESNTDLLFAVLEELERRHQEEIPSAAAASDIRAKAWWQLVNEEISQAEYRDIVLFTALSEEEKAVLEERISRDILRAQRCRFTEE